MANENVFSNGQIVYVKVRSLPNHPSSYYEGFDISWLFKVVNAKIAKKENPLGGGFDRIDDKEYWRPFLGYAQFYEYTAGDEFVQQTFAGRNTSTTTKDPSGTVSFLNSPTSVAQTKYSNLPEGTQKVFQGEIYRAVSQFVSWESISKYDTLPTPKRMSYGNPYNISVIRVWVKVSGSNLSESTGYTYWFNPQLNTFHLINPKIDFLLNSPGTTEEDSLREGKVLSLMLQGKTRAQALEQLNNSQEGTKTSPASTTSGSNSNLATGGGGTSSSTGTAPNSTIKATVRVRGNFGFIEPGEIEGGGAQMVQYYKAGNSQAPLTARHIFTPKPNEINYQNLGSEWTEIERSGRIPLVDWKNYKLMRVSFQFLVIPDATYRLGAFGQTADDGITLSIDSKLEVLRNMASRPYPVILYGFDELLANANPYSFSTGAGVQFAITDFSISSMIRTSNGSINRAQCDITLQEVPIEYINIISLPKLIPGQTIRPPRIDDPVEYGERLLITDQANDLVEIKGYQQTAESN